MLAFARGVGAGRWCWGRFWKHSEEDSAISLSIGEIESLPGVQKMPVPGRAAALFLVATTVDGQRKFVSLLSSYTLCRLFRRFVLMCLMERRHSVPCDEIYTVYLTSSSTRKACLNAFTDAVFSSIDLKRKHMRTEALSTMYSVTPSFYELSAILCAVDCELFADSINESGVLNAFCSADPADKAFESIGLWELNEESIVGGAGNPPFCPQFLQKVFRRFDASVKLPIPYCGILIVPSSSKYQVLRLCSTGQGAVIMTIPPNNLGMKPQQIFYTSNQDFFFPQPLNKQGLLVCIWANISYWKLRPPPADVEDVIDAWIMYSCRSPRSVVAHRDVISAIFPRRLRSQSERADKFVEPLLQ